MKQKSSVLGKYYPKRQRPRPRANLNSVSLARLKEMYLFKHYLVAEKELPLHHLLLVLRHRRHHRL